MTRAALKRVKSQKNEEENSPNSKRNEQKDENSLKILQMPEEIEKKQENLSKLNMMNEVTFDEPSIVSQNRSIDIAANSQRKLLEGSSRRRVSILKNQNIFVENHENETFKKKNKGKKILFMIN